MYRYLKKSFLKVMRITIKCLSHQRLLHWLQWNLATQ